MLLFISFSRRRLRGFAMPFFKFMYLVKPSLAFSLRDGFIGRIILMRLRRSRGIFVMSKNVYKNIHLPAVQIRGHVAFSKPR